MGVNNSNVSILTLNCRGLRMLPFGEFALLVLHAHATTQALTPPLGQCVMCTLLTGNTTLDDIQLSTVLFARYESPS